MAPVNYLIAPPNFTRPGDGNKPKWLRRDCLFEEGLPQTVSLRTTGLRPTSPLIFGVLFLFLLLLTTGCSDGEKPNVTDLLPLAPKCAKNRLNLEPDTLAWMPTSIEVKVLGTPKINLPIVGHFGPGGTNLTIWPVEFNLKITYRKNEFSLNPLGRGPYHLGDQDLSTPFSSMKKMERVQETTMLFYAYKVMNGQWELNYLPPNEVTPFYRKWWNQLWDQVFS